MSNTFTVFSPENGAPAACWPAGWKPALHFHSWLRPTDIGLQVGYHDISLRRGQDTEIETMTNSPGCVG